MPCKKKYKRIRAKDVGRTGFHYIKIGVKTKKGKRGGVTERIGGLIKYKKKNTKRKSAKGNENEFKRPDFRIAVC